jgi:NitT/TauT family transport system ATP-binding protein
MPNALLEARNLQLGHRSRRKGTLTLAVSDLDLQVMEHEFVVIVGPSGCGKTTFLEAVAGLVPVTSGDLELDGKTITGPGPERSLVFQHASLYPWRTVLSNVQFGLQVQGRLNAETKQRAQELLDMVGLRHVADKYPHELSGGMRQRVNLARALATDPTLLLLDEPFGALDAQTRDNLQEELLRIWQADAVGGRKTALFVTHDVNEAVLLADRVIVFSPGPGTVAHVVTIDTPRPRSVDWRRSAEFIAYGDEILTALHHESPSSKNSARDHANGDPAGHGRTAEDTGEHSDGGEGVRLGRAAQ